MDAPKPQPVTRVPTRKEALTNELAFKARYIQQYDIAQELDMLQDAMLRIEESATRKSEIARTLLPGVQAELDAIEAELVLDIAGQLDDKGKPVYSNAESRKAALDRAMHGHAGYQALVTRRTALQGEADALDASIHLEHQRSTAARYSIEHKTAALRLLGL